MQASIIPVVLLLQVCVPSFSRLTFLHQMHQDVILTNNVLNTASDVSLKVQSRTACATRCLQKPTCTIVFYNEKLRLCNIYLSKSKTFVYRNVIPANGWLCYYHKQRICVANLYTYDNVLERCIKGLNIFTTYNMAKYACEQESAKLVKVDNSMMWQFVKMVLGTANINDAYIQGTKDTGGTWRFDDGTIMNFLPWAPRQPSGGSLNIHIDMWSADGYRFHDVRGQLNYGYVCELVFA